MEIIVLPTLEGAATFAAEQIEKQVKGKTESVFSLATGNTMKPIYAKLREKAEIFTKSFFFNLDEHVGLSSQDSHSFSAFLRHHLKGILLKGNTCFLNGSVDIRKGDEVLKLCEDYEQKIKDKGGIDLQLLGISTEGHIGYNEPTSSLQSRTRLKTLSHLSISEAVRHFPHNAKTSPEHVLTAGIGTILDARHCMLVAFGKSKREAVAAMIEGPLTAFLPASALQMHPKVTIILDEDAASQLRNVEYYKAVFKGKPKWQQ
jgi:glucosamine-6-phosphate deaminase